MSKLEKLLVAMRNSPEDVRFADALKVATLHFGEPRIRGSHHVFSARGVVVNLQPSGSKAKAYQVLQLLAAIETKEANNV